MRVLAVLASLWLLACDSRATASDPARADLASKEYETCAATVDCADGLRCLDHACRRTARSVVGDYHVAAGAAALARGDREAAVEALEAAVGHYNAEKIPLPPDVDCAYGGTLAAARGDHANRAARALHRCVLAVPAGSPLRTRALAHLATLADLGLDPLLLGAVKPADQYLTKDVVPTTDKLKVSVTASPTPTGKHWPKVPAALGGADLRPALVACWVKHNEATRKRELVASFGLKISYVQNPNYEDEGSWVVRLADPSGSHETCVHAAIEPALKALRIRERIESELTVTIK